VRHRLGLATRTHGFLLAFHTYGSILHYLRDRARYWSEIVIFSYPLAFDATVRGGGPRWNIAIPFGMEKLLPDGKKNFEDMYNRLDTMPACDGQTSCDGIVRAMHTRRAV